MPFEDGEGQRWCLIDDGGKGAASPWERSPAPAEHQIRGPRSCLTVHEVPRTAFVLTEVMNMCRVRDYAAHGAQIHVFAMGEAKEIATSGAELHVIDTLRRAEGAGPLRRVPHA